MKNNHHLYIGHLTRTGLIHISRNGLSIETVDPQDVGYYLVLDCCGERLAEKFGDDFDRVVCVKFQGDGFSIWSEQIRQTVDQLQKCFGI